MKLNIISLLILVMSTTFTHSQTVFSSCDAHDSIINSYKADASRLALNKIYRQNLPYKDSVEIHKTHIDTILRALIAVYNAIDLPARDTVVNQLNIHEYAPSMNIFSIAADYTLPWMQTLKSQQDLPSGELTLDSILSHYKFYFHNYHDFDYVRNTFYFDEVFFQSDTNYYNIKALFTTLTEIHGVFEVNEDALIGDGNHITDTITPNYIELTYQYGWEDCPMGCISKRFWKFKVYFDCTVEYVGSYGDPLYGLYTNNIDSIYNTFVYPNSFRDEITINKLTDFQYSIFDMMGKIVIKGHSEDGKISGLENLNDNFYILKIEVDNAYKIIKITKDK